jgi:hypothetical protein
MSNLSFPLTSKCGKIFNDFIFSNKSFLMKYESLAKSKETVNINGNKGLNLILEKDIWGAKTSLLHIPILNGDSKISAISYIDRTSDDFELINYFVSQKIQIGLFVQHKTTYNEKIAIYHPTESELYNIETFTIQMAKEHSQKHVMTLIMEKT